MRKEPQHRQHVISGDCAICTECQGRAHYYDDRAHCAWHNAYDVGYEYGFDAGLHEGRKGAGIVATS